MIIQEDDVFDYFPEEAVLASNLMNGLNDMIVSLIFVASKGPVQYDTIEKIIWEIRNESTRIDVLCSLIEDWAEQCSAQPKHASLARETSAMISAVRRVLPIRNAYAHAHWTPHPDDTKQLCRLNWRKAYKRKNIMEDLQPVSKDDLKRDLNTVKLAIKKIGQLSCKTPDHSQEMIDLYDLLNEAGEALSRKPGRDASQQAENPPKDQTP